MEITNQFCLVLFLFVTAEAFPTDGDNPGPTATKSFPSKNEKINSTAAGERKETQSENSSSSLTTTSSLLFKDTKPILTYLLGQPKNQGSLSSPVQLLSPDRYEFFTFDDDGQIVKKLMSVKEIQKIIANSEKGYAGEHDAPVEYYQILTVTPDVESIPSVSRINPNEPLFSIHDVIASVQNVLKSEINTKQTQSIIKNNNFLSADGGDRFEIMTEKTKNPHLVESQTVTATASPQASATYSVKSNSPDTTTDSQITTKKFSTFQADDSLNEKFELIGGSQETRVPEKRTPQETQKPEEPPSQGIPEPENPTSQENPKPQEMIMQEVKLKERTPQEIHKPNVPTLQESFKPKEPTLQETFNPEERTPQETRDPEESTLKEKFEPEQPATEKNPMAERPAPQEIINAEEVMPQETLKHEESTPEETPKPLFLTASITPQNLVTFTASKSIPTTATPSRIFQSTQATETISNTPVEIQALTNSQVGTVSSEKFSDVESFTLGQNWRIEEPDAEITKTEASEKPAEDFVRVDSLPESFGPEEGAKTTNIQEELKNSTSAQLISFTPDLANSVSTVLWQIASENAMLDNVNQSKGSTHTVSDQVTETFETLESKNFFEGSLSPSSTIAISTQDPAKTQETTVNPIKVFEAILKPQNAPRPFQQVHLIEKTTPREIEVKIEPVSSATVKFEENGHSVANRVAAEVGTTTTATTEAEELILLSKSEQTTLTSNSKEPISTSENPTLNLKLEEPTSNSDESILISKSGEATSKPWSQASQNGEQELFSSSTVPQTFVVSVSPDAVVQSPEQLKPELKSTTEKVILLVNDTTASNQTQQIIEGVTIIQEANIGQIKRTTEYPGQNVKDIQGAETTESASVEGDSLTSSESNLLTTHLPYSEPEPTTLLVNAEEKAETRTESSDDEGGLLLTTEQPQTEEKEVEPFDKMNITFVPMIIKAPFDFKGAEEISQNEKNETAGKEEGEEEEKILPKEDEMDIVQSSTTFPTGKLEDELESKVLPDSELKSILPGSTIDENQKETVEEPEFEEEEIGSFKQNNPFQNIFGKPQRPFFGKPIRPKPQTYSSKPSKPVQKEPIRGGTENKKPYESQYQSSPSLLELEAAPDENLGLEVTVANLDEDVKRFSDLCNELAFSLWSSVTHNGLSFVRSIVISPFAMTSLLAMVFLGARGPTSGQMNDILKLDDMVSFNPHLVFRNVTESLVIARNPGIATAAFVRELYSDKSKGKLLDFYKERAQQFYDGHVEEINFKSVGEILRRQTNHLLKRQTWGKITDFLRGSTLIPRPPLAAFSANVFQTDCSKASIKDRDGEMYFVILPASRLRRLVPIPAVVWRSDFLAGYEPQLDATVVSISLPNSAVSTIFVLPGHQGVIAPGDTLARLERQLLGSPYKKGHWSRMMKSLLPRPGLELQIPRMSHKSVVNVTSSLQRMGLKDLFSADKADLTGLNGLANDLHLSDMIQVNLFSTCGEESIGSRHHSEIYPATPIMRREKSVDTTLTESVDNLFAVSDFEDPSISALPLELRPRQARVPLSRPGAKIPEPPRLRFDRPFLFFVRHNPTGLILHMGRFNPRLMP